MKKIVAENISFLLPYFLILSSSLSWLLLYPKDIIHLSITSHYNSFFDFFFKYETFLGDGFFAIALVILFLFIRYGYSFVLLLSYSVSSIITQILKRTIFDDALRPSKHFEGTNSLRMIEGLDYNIYNSFPSGHATTSFAIFICLAFFSKNNYFKFLFFLIACITAFSRVYLSQHFLNDIVAGSAIGVITSLFVFAFYKQNIESKFPLFEKNIFNR